MMDKYQKPELVKSGESDESLLGFASILETEAFVAFVAFAIFIIEAT